MDGGIIGGSGSGPEVRALVQETNELLRQLAELQIPKAFAAIYDVVWELAAACWDLAGAEKRHARLLLDSVRVGCDSTPRRRYSHAETFGSEGDEDEPSVTILHVPLDGTDLVAVGRDADPLWDVPWDPFHMRPVTLVANPSGGPDVVARTRFNVAASRPLHGEIVALAGCTIHWSSGDGLTFALANARHLCKGDPGGRGERQQRDDNGSSGGESSLSILSRKDLTRGLPNFESRLDLALRTLFETEINNDT